MTSWKPSFIKKNEKFKNIPNKMNTIWNNKNENSFFGKKTNQCIIDDNNFPLLAGKKEITINSNKEPRKQSSKWLDIAKKEVKVENKNNKVKIKEDIQIEEWNEMDSKDEHFDLMHSDDMLDINNVIISYCKEKNLPFYDNYNRFNNLVDFIKDTSSIYHDIFKEKAENKEEDEDCDEEELLYDEYNM